MTTLIFHKYNYKNAFAENRMSPLDSFSNSPVKIWFDLKLIAKEFFSFDLCFGHPSKQHIKSRGKCCGRKVL